MDTTAGDPKLSAPVVDTFVVDTFVGKTSDKENRFRLRLYK